MPGLGNEAVQGPAHLTPATRTGKNGMLSIRRADAQCQAQRTPSYSAFSTE